jgi:hypothetical protein
VAKSEEPNRLFRELIVDSLRRPGPISPIRLAQFPIRIGERYMSRKQRRHHVFGNRLLVAEAIAYDGRTRERAEVYCIVSGTRYVKELQFLRPRHIRGISDADDGLRVGIRLSIGGAAQKVRQKADVRRRAHEAAKIVAERSSIRAVKYDAHRVRSRTGQ